MVIHTLKRTVEPNKVMYQNSHGELCVRRIKKINEKLIIKKYRVKLNSHNLITEIILDSNCHHPNSHPESKLFCIPNHYKYLDFCEDNVQRIEEVMRMLNLTNSYTSAVGLFELGDIINNSKGELHERN